MMIRLNKLHQHGFSYVGACQVGVSDYMFPSYSASRPARGVQALAQPKRSGRAGGFLEYTLNYSTSKYPRRFHSAIRALPDVVPAHEIKYGRIDAHSRSRTPLAVLKNS